jgi:asparagine synthase (glutamine-hydrolysing)
MCGILGFIGNSIPKEIFLNALNKLSHRGPDGYSIWETEGVKLGHRRLSIIDLTDSAKQPMEVYDRFVITFNGEIYNYQELKIELEILGCQFKSNSDTEVLLYAYILWGEKCLQKLNGMWAFAIWDKQKKELFLSRDRLGKKPLFYSFLKNEFIFASEMKAIYPLMEELKIDRVTFALAEKDNFCYEATEKCLIQDIVRFPAGSFGIYKNGKLSISKFWIPLEEIISVPKKYSDQVEEFRELFIDACKIRMRSDVAIGTALSGGIDSSATICTMNYIAKSNSVNVDWQHAFVATFSGTALDETEYAKTVTDYLNINSEFIEIDPLKELNNIFKQAYMFEEIYYAPTIPFVQLYRKVSEKVKVTIDGHGADELFGGYPFDVNFALIDSLPNLFSFKEIADAVSNMYLSPTKNYTNKLKFALINKYPWLKKISRNHNIQKKFPGLDFLNSRLYASTYLNILPTLLRNYDRYSMMSGVEIRMPFLDYRILKFAFSIPYDSKIRGGYSKAIIRDALKDIVPKKIIARKNKIGFNSPIDMWVKKREFKEWLSDEISSSDFVNSTLINSKEVSKSITELINNKNVDFFSGSNLFQKIIPYFWEKGMKQYAK